MAVRRFFDRPFGPLGIRTRIVIGVVVIVGTMTIATVAALPSLRRVETRLDVIVDGYIRMSRLATDAKSAFENRDHFVSRTFTSATLSPVPGDEYARTFFPRLVRDRLGALQSEVEALEPLVGLSVETNPDGKSELTFLVATKRKIVAAHQEYEGYEEAVDSFLLDAARDAQTASIAEKAIAMRSDQIKMAFETIVADTEGRIAEGLLDVREASQQSKDRLLAGLLASWIASFIALVVVWRSFRPLDELVRTARAIGRGSFDSVVEGELPTELAAFSGELREMAKGLRDREHALAARHHDLADLKAFADDVIRSVQVGILVLNDRKEVRTINPAARSYLALPLVEVEGRQLLSFPHVRENLRVILDHIDDVRHTGRTLAFSLVPIGDPPSRIVDVGLFPIRDQRGASSKDVLMLVEDVTVREKTRERLVESERLAAIGRLAAQITHEIRNPLSSIGLNIELLDDDVPLLPPDRRDEVRSILRSVSREIDRLAQITEGYLRYARLPAPKPTEGDVGDLLADLSAFCQSEAHQLGVMLELHVEDSIPHVHYDPPRLRQALLNLLRNAEDAAGRGGTVRLRAERRGVGVRMTIEDSGPGIAVKDRDRLFQPFFTTKPSGTGLGLTLTKEIIDEHKGSLTLGESALGGAAFVIDLPGPEPTAKEGS